MLSGFRRSRRVHSGFFSLGSPSASLRPDVVAIVAGDHVEAFFLNAVPALAVYVGAECAGTVGPYRYRFPVHEPSWHHGNAVVEWIL